MEKEALFTEVQSFRQWWLWLVLLLVSVPLLGILIYQITTGQQVGAKPASNGILAVILLVIALPILLGFYFARLFTVIDTDGISYGFSMSGGNLTTIAFADIAEMEMVEYRSSGLGVRLSAKYGTIYNTSWGVGLAITKTDGTKLLIGTQRPEEMKAAIDKVRKR